MAITVTATAAGADSSTGIALTVKVVTGALAAASQPGATAGSITVTTPQLAITPTHSGSWVYGAVLSGNAGTFTAVANTVFTRNTEDDTNSVVYGTFRSSGTTTTSSTTYGASAPAGSAGTILIALAEILASGTLAEDASSPAAVETAGAKTVTTASFTPPAGSLLVATVSAATQGDGATDTVTVTAAGGSLTFKQVATCPITEAGNIATVWVADVPGAAHTASASLSVTPSFAASQARIQAAALTVTPSLAAEGAFAGAPVSSLQDDFSTDDLAVLWANSFGGASIAGGFATLPCTTSFSGLFSTRAYDLTGSAALCRVFPDNAGSGFQTFLELTDGGGTNKIDLGYDGGSLTGLLNGSSVGSAAYDGTGHAWWKISESGGTLSWSVSPDGVSWTVLWTAAAPGWAITALFAEVFTGRTAGADGTSFVQNFNVAPASNTATAAFTVTPSFSAAPHAAHVASASLTVTPSFAVVQTAEHFRTAGLTVVPSLTADASKAEGAPPGYPDGVLGQKIELLLGGTWTDITDVALPDGRQSGQVKSGQQDGAQQPQPAALAGTWDNPDGDLSPRNSDSPYFGQLRQNTPARISFTSPYGGYLRLENDDEDMASAADTAALHVTGSIELRIAVMLSDYRACTLAARNDGTTPSWSLLLNSGGTLSFFWYDSGGTLRHVDSSVVPAVSWRAFRVTMDASDGTVTFYGSGSIDGTWTQLGDAASGTSGAATSVRAGNSPLVTGWSASASAQMRGQVSGLRLYDGLADDGGSIVADAAFSIQVPGTTSWTDLAGLPWTLSGGAELTSRDYRMHGELASLQPTAQPSGNVARVQAQVSGRLRRVQQGGAPAIWSPIKRAILAQAGDLFPVSYWPMEDAAGSKFFGPAVGSFFITPSAHTVRPAADSSFECSAPLPTLGGDGLGTIIDTYTATDAWAVRFLFKLGDALPASGTQAILALVETDGTGAVDHLVVFVNSDGTVTFSGFAANGSAVFTGTEQAFTELAGPALWSVEATVPSGGAGVQYALVALAPGAAEAHIDAHTVTGHGSTPGTVTQADMGDGGSTAGVLTDSVIGHLFVQKAWTSLFTFSDALNAWRTELAADRFARVCADNGITARILGWPALTQAMGPQPIGSLWTVLKDCGDTEQGIIYEPRDSLSLGLRTRQSMITQGAGITLDFDESNLPGDLQPTEDDTGFLNDVTGSMPTGETWRSVLDDGSATSISEPEDGGMGTYAGNVPFSLNVSEASDLPAAVDFYLQRVSVDGARYRNMVCDFGVPGAPAADAARLRPGDLVKITNVPAVYQSGDIEQLAMGAAETFGPGRKIAWNGIPWTAYTG